MSSMYELPPDLVAAPPVSVPAQPTPRLRLVPDVPLDFDDAVRRITPRLQRYARRRLGDAHEAEELVQEALLRAYKHGDQLLTEDDLIAWCTVVTGRLVIDRLRVRGRSTSVADVPEGSRVSRDTAEVVVARDEARMALDALDAMPARQAAVLWAREVEGQAYDEIGKRFGMTEPAVRSILTRARKALRKEYASRGGTLPVAGLAALAPWVSGLRFADRVRSAATRLAAPAAIGAMALGLVGGALYSPLFHPDLQAPSRVQAVVSSSVGTSAVVAPPAVVKPLVSNAGAAPVAAAPDAVTVITTPERVAQSTCIGSTNHGTAVGSESCTGGGKASRLYVRESLPDNPTRVRDIGVESDKINCAQIPTTPLTACQPSSTTPGAHS
ncbi:MAG: polymerase sigma-70 factor, subfamily [Actinomycetota bacterium]|nr:polymerase sigma-70 factor, subfamily [Actinomycetota bacterium]